VNGRYLPSGIPNRGRDGACPTCGIKERTQHTLGQASKCDGIKWAKREALKKAAAK
jgi:hypothetical protein